MSRPRSYRAALAAAVALAGAGLAAPAAAADDEAASSYIVVLTDSIRSASAVADEHRRNKGAAVTYTYEHALKGYAAELTGTELAAVRSDRRVAYVERDGVVQASELTTQSGAVWGLDRIDDRPLAKDGTYEYASAGAGVTAYVIDTGIAAHPDFGTRLSTGATFVSDDNGTNDCDGHGTHVAGTIGSATYGVAKAVTLVPVRVLDCGGSGTTSGVIAGVNWVAANAAVGSSVANLSLGGGANTSLDQAVAALAAQIPTAVAAGNGNQAGKAQDACNYSPARVPAVLTVGATTATDAKTSWSNYGDCVDLFAPGAGITSTWLGGATNVISGTSMAAPHVAGALALELSSSGSDAASVMGAVKDRATNNIVTSAKTLAANDLLHIGTAADDLGLTDGTGGGGGKPTKNSR